MHRNVTQGSPSPPCLGHLAHEYWNWSMSLWLPVVLISGNFLVSIFPSLVFFDGVHFYRPASSSSSVSVPSRISSVSDCAKLFVACGERACSGGVGLFRRDFCK
jgi:hypothetical protein